MESPYKIKVEPKAKDDLREVVAYYVSVAPSKIAKNFLKEYSSIKDFIKHFPHQHKYRGDLIGLLFISCLLIRDSVFCLRSKFKTFLIFISIRKYSSSSTSSLLSISLTSS